MISICLDFILFADLKILTLLIHFCFKYVKFSIITFFDTQMELEWGTLKWLLRFWKGFIKNGLAFQKIYLLLSLKQDILKDKTEGRSWRPNSETLRPNSSAFGRPLTPLHVFSSCCRNFLIDRLLWNFLVTKSLGRGGAWI